MGANTTQIPSGEQSICATRVVVTEGPDSNVELRELNMEVPERSCTWRESGGTTKYKKMTAQGQD